MALSANEQDIAAEQTNVGNFVDNIGRNLFVAERYDDLEAALEIFFSSNTAGTVAESRAHFYNTRLAPLFKNYVITSQLDTAFVLEWEKSFPNLISIVNPTLFQESSNQGYCFNDYIKGEISKGRTISSLVTESINTCLEFKKTA